MKPIIKLIYSGLFLCLLNCNGEPKATVEYKFVNNADKNFIECGNENALLLEEALLSFEDDIVKHYDTLNQRTVNAYPRFITHTISNKIDCKSIASEHSKNILKVLEQQPDLWVIKNNIKQINYNNALFTCIGKHIENEDLNVTYNALISTNSMSLRMFGATLKKQAHMLIRDRHLAVFVALDLYYSRLQNTEQQND